MPLARLQSVTCAAAIIAMAACSPIQYVSRPIDADASAAGYSARSAQSDGLRDFAVANGYAPGDWPPLQWGLKELTLTAWYFDADMRTARARATVALAKSDTGGASRNWSGTVKPEHHSRSPGDDSPWSLGLELEIPLVAQDRRAALAERNAFLVDAADIDVAMAAWLVRARVRDGYHELQASRDVLQALDAQLMARTNLVSLMNRRVEAGMISARDLATERFMYSQLKHQRDQQLVSHQRALADLAASLGLPLDVAAKMDLRFEAPFLQDTDLAAGSLRRQALRNRLDVHRKLLEFGTADAEVKQAVAAQNPGITLGPGYAWDQGDNIWSLALGLSLPPATQARAVIREAMARRELAAEHFAGTQTTVMFEAERAGAQYQLARERIAASAQQLGEQQEQEARVQRQFDAGAADRVQRVTARIDTLAAQMQHQAVLAEGRHALAQLEDALQRPLQGDVEALPRIAVSRSTDASKAMVKP